MRIVNIAIENKNFSDLNPIVCGYEKCIPKVSGGITLRPYYLVHYVKKGSGIFETEGKKYNVKSGQIFILHKNQTGYYVPDEKDPWEYCWIGFDGKLASMIENAGGHVFDFSGNIFEEMLESVKYKNTRSEYLAGKLFNFMSCLFEDKIDKTSYVKQVKDYIKSSYMLPIQVEEIAKMFNINRRYLSRIFREKTGLTIKNYITQIKMNKAEELLKQGFKVSEVAQMVGYDDGFNFSKMFKKLKGYSPNQKRLEFLTKK